jgi:hypothetical protein
MNKSLLHRTGYNVCIFYALLMVMLGSANIYSQEKEPSSKPLPQVELAGSQLLKIHSSITGQEYDLHINLPQHYNDTSKTFPVIYLIDSQWDFPLVTAIYGDQYYDGFMPSAIIVGITWGGEHPDYDKRRAYDLTPTDAGQPAQFGNAEKFLSFIQKEAIPYIDSKYRTNKNDRTLAGHSFGGLFTLYALFSEPALFNRYVSGSPAWSWDRSSLYKYSEKFSKINLAHPVKAFMFVGEYEDVPGFEKLADVIKGYKLYGLELATQVIQGSGHAGTKPEGYNKGLQHIFARKSITVNPAILDRYVGEYEINPQVHVKVDHENGSLVARIPGSPAITVFAESENDFYIKGTYLVVHFQKDSDGKTTGFQLEQYSGVSFAKKIK